MEVTHELVTPKKAEAWLNSNTINRTLRPGVVERYAADMKSNRWTNCNAAIAIYDDGNLADGQHRLYAIIESGCSIKFTIHRGLSCEDGLNIDTGLGRSLIDNARISGIEPGITTALVAVCRGIADGEHASNTSRLGRCGYSNSERIAIVQQHRDAGRWVISHGPRGRNVRIGPVMSAVGRAWYVEKDHARLQRFCSIMTNGIYDGDGESAAAALLPTSPASSPCTQALCGARRS